MWAFVPVIGLIISLFTLPSYGVNWDTYQHLARGQSYLRYIFWGELNSETLPDPCTHTACDLSVTPRVSVYEKTVLDVAWANKMTIGHPPLMDILLAGSNQLLYKRFGLIDDISSYHVLLVGLAFSFALLIGFWSYEAGGIFPAIVSVLSLYTLPLFFAEQHFNIKDPPVAFFINFAAYALYKAVTKQRFRWFIMAGIFSGLALGTKFNVVFLLLPLLLWIPFSLHLQKKQYKAITIVGLVTVALMAWGIFWFSYPAIWQHPFAGTVQVIKYYQEISQAAENPCFYPMLTGQWFQCSHGLAFILLISTIPIITLVLCCLGIFAGFKRIHQHKGVYLFWILLFVLPILRATLPIVQLYGGSLRQIMEFVGPMSLLAGLGAGTFISSLKGNRLRIFAQICIVILFLPIIYTSSKLHPNQNLFYNSLVGGISGAKKLGFPVVENTYGNGYKQLIDWINTNTPKDSRLATVVGIGSSFPPLYIRSDLTYLADDSDITKHSGEYLMEITKPGLDIADRFRYRYTKQLLRPLHQIQYDGVVIGEVWHNVPENMYEWAQNSHTVQVSVVPISDTTIDVVLPKNKKMKQLQMNTQNEQCLYALTTGVVLIKSNINNDWLRLTEGISFFNRIISDSTKQRLYVFAGEETQTVRIITKPTTCRLESVDYQLEAFGTGEDDQLTILLQPHDFSW